LHHGQDLLQLVLGEPLLKHRAHRGGGQLDGPVAHERHDLVDVLLGVGLDLLGDGFLLVLRNALGQGGAGAGEHLRRGLLGERTGERFDAGLLDLQDLDDQFLLGGGGLGLGCAASGDQGEDEKVFLEHAAS
jgi:hypothetical protein